MVLVDTSVWIDHLRRGNDLLASLLRNGEVIVHPFVVGELACGYISRRGAFLKDLHALGQAPVATTTEVLAFIEAHGLMGLGIGFVDVHLLASCMLAGAKLMTADRRLAQVAEAIGLQCLQ